MDDSPVQPQANTTWSPDDKDNSKEPGGPTDVRVGVPDVDVSKEGTDTVKAEEDTTQGLK